MTATLGDLIEKHLARTRERLERADLAMLETGSIRNPELRYRDGDGWSTIALATHVRVHGGNVTSIDLNTRTADAVLAAHGMRDDVHLVTGYSVDVLAGYLQEGRKFDFILLDSENDAQLTLHEWYLAHRLINDGGTIMLDDIEPGSKDVLKGNLIIPHFQRQKIQYKLLRRSKNAVQTGVAVVDF